MATMKEVSTECRPRWVEPIKGQRDSGVGGVKLFAGRNRKVKALATVMACAAMLGVSPPDASASHDEIEAVIDFLESYAPSVEFPAVGALFSHDDTGKINKVCGGSLIAPRWLLTVGHCVDGSEVSALRVFLQAEGILAVADTFEFCRPPADDEASAICDIETDTVALVKLAEPAAVWPWMTRGNADLPRSLALVGYGLTKPPERVGLGSKAHRAVPIEACGDGDAGHEFCQTTGKLPCDGYSGSPLLADEAQAWEQVALARKGGEACKTGTARYPDVSVAAFQRWIESTIKDHTVTWTEQRREIRGWGRVQFGKLRIEPPSDVSADYPVVNVPEEPDGASWPMPGDWSRQQNTVSVTSDPKVDLLRFTMNYDAYSYKSQCQVGNDPCENHFGLCIHAPQARSRCDCECTTGTVFVQCDCLDPTPGDWTFEVLRHSGAGPYQLLALPLGPLESVPPDLPEPIIPTGASVGVSHEAAVPRTFVSGTRLGSAPIIRVNVDDEGHPDEVLMNSIRNDVEQEIRLLEIRLRRARRSH